MKANKILVSIFLLLYNLECSSIVPPTGCPLVCSQTGSATFCALNTGDLCVTGNAQFGGNVTICGQVNITRVYGYFFDSAFNIMLSASNPTKIPFSTAGVGGVVNVAHPNATDVVIMIPGTYIVTYRVEPDVALNINSDFEIQKNGVLIPGSIFTLAAQLSNIEISAISILTANSGDVITVVTTALVNAPLSGKSSLLVQKIA